ncbi:MAG: 3-keto-disaccharide hydrolase [Bacteroidota bacterium]
MKKSVHYSLILTILLAVTGCSNSKQRLFNGKNLEGWEVKPAELASHWEVRDGKILHGENPNEKGSMIWTTDTFRDYELELEYRTLSNDYDTGIFPRGEGHQVQIGISRSLQRDMTGCIYAPKDEQGAYPGQTDKVEKFHKVGEWNHLRIILDGKVIKTFLNGEPFVEYKGITINKEGPIGLQLHGGVHMEVEFRNIRLVEH